MKLKIFAVRDVKLGAYMNPWTAHTSGAAERAFGDEVNNEKSPMHKHPEDYQLFHIGDYDDQTGEIQPQKPQHICDAAQLKQA